MTFPLTEVRSFARVVQLPTRDYGLIPIKKFFGTQEHMLKETAAGWERGIRTFVYLKGGRQIGGTSILDILTLLWLQMYEGMIGMLVADDDDNRDYRRDVILQMLASLPPSHRFRTDLDNQKHLRWSAPSHSRLLFMAAGKRSGKRLGQGKGANYLEADEVASWTDERAIKVLRATLSEKHPRRFYGWVSTGAVGPFQDMWKAADKAVTQKAVFIGWWRHEDYKLARRGELWARYGTPPVTSDERAWLREIKRRWSFTVSPEQLAWHRWKLAEDFDHDETLFAQEFGSLPDDCFQSFGDKFVPAAAIQRLRIELRQREDARKNAKGETPPPVKPLALRYEWSRYFDDVKVVEEHDPAKVTLTVYEEPQPGALYLVGGKSAFSDDPDQPQDAAIVWRLYPDLLVQVAEYVTEEADVLRFAWALLHLCGAYRMTRKQTYLCVEAQGTGRGVIDEVRRMQDTGYGVSPKIRPRHRELFDFGGAISHHIQRRPDTLSTGFALHYMSNTAARTLLMNGLRSQLIRGEVEIQSAALIDECAGLRRGGDGDNDSVGGGKSFDGRAVAAALGVRSYLEDALKDVQRLVPPKTPPPGAPLHVGQAMVQAYLNGAHVRAMRGVMR